MSSVVHGTNKQTIVISVTFVSNETENLRLTYIHTHTHTRHGAINSGPLIYRRRTKITTTMPSRERKGGGITTRHTSKSQQAESMDKERTGRKKRRPSKKKKTKMKRVSKAEDIDPEKLLTRVRRFLKQRYCQKKNMGKVFRLWDKNKDGQIDAEELHDIFHLCGFPEMTQERSKDIHGLFIKDGTGKIKYDDFLDIVFGQKYNDADGQSSSTKEGEHSSTVSVVDVPASEEESAEMNEDEKKRLVSDTVHILRERYRGKHSLGKIFQLWDKNRDGEIDATEMHEIFECLGLKHISKSKAKIIHDVCGCETEGGRLNYNRFVNMVFDPSYEYKMMGTFESGVSHLNEKEHVDMSGTDITDAREYGDVRCNSQPMRDSRSIEDMWRAGLVLDASNRSRRRQQKPKTVKSVSTRRRSRMRGDVQRTSDNMKLVRDCLLRAIGSKCKSHDRKSMRAFLSDAMEWSSKEENHLFYPAFRRSLRALGISASAVFARDTFKRLDVRKQNAIEIDDFVDSVCDAMRTRPSNEVKRSASTKSKHAIVHMPKNMVISGLNEDIMANAEDIEAFDEYHHKHNDCVVTEDFKKRFWVDHMLENEITSPQLEKLTRGIKTKILSTAHSRRRKLNTGSTVASLLTPSKELSGSSMLTSEGVVNSVCTLPRGEFDNAFNLLNSRSRVSALKASKHAKETIFNTRDEKAMQRWRDSIHSIAKESKLHEQRVRDEAKRVAKDIERRIDPYKAFQRKHCGYW